MKIGSHVIQGWCRDLGLEPSNVQSLEAYYNRVVAEVYVLTELGNRQLLPDLSDAWTETLIYEVTSDETD